MGILTYRRKHGASLLIAAIVGAVVPIGSAQADTNPATQALELTCSAVPETSVATLSGIPAAGVGETARIGTRLHFDEGTLYQDIAQRPDGSTYFASVIETTWLAPAGLTLIPGSIQFTINGVVQTIVPGTQPSVGDWVIEETPAGPGSRYRLYFPGDAAAMLADPIGAGLPSVTVPAGGADYALTVAAYVADVPSTTAGTVFDASECFASISTGPSTRNSSRPHAQLAVLDPVLNIDKQSMSGTTVSEGAVLNYRLALTSPLNDPDSLIPSGDPGAVEVIDEVPPELTPLGPGNIPLADGQSNAAGGVWNAAARTLTFMVPHIAAGTSFNINYPVQVVMGIGTGVGITNTARVTWKSSGGTYPARTYGPETDSVTVVTAAPAPAIVKTVDKPVVGMSTPLEYTLHISFPASAAPFYNATAYDTLPDGMQFDGTTSVICTSGCAETAVNIPQYTSVASGWTRFGWYFGNLSPGVQRDFEIRYNAHVVPTYHTGVVVPLETEFVNRAEIRTNSVDRLGAVVPQAAAPPSHDVIMRSEVVVTYSRPTLNVTKSINIPEPADPVVGMPIKYTVRVTNTGGLAAGYFRIDDSCIACRIIGLDPSSSPGVTLSWMGTNNIGFEFNGSLAPGNFIDVVYEVVPDTPAFISSTAKMENRVQVYNLRDPFGVTYPELVAASVSRTFLTPNLGIQKSIVAVDGQPYTGQVISTVGSEITYRVAVTNTGTGTGTIASLRDDVPGLFTLISTTPNVTATQSGAGDIINFAPITTPWNVAPGGSFLFDYTVSTNGTGAGTQTNTATINYTDGTGRTSVDGRAFTATSQASGTLEAPVLRIQKTPEATDNQYIMDGGSEEFELRVSNISTTVPATNVQVNDVLPASLVAALFDEASQVTWSGVGTAGTVTADPAWTSSNPAFIISRLGPGQVVTIRVPVIHDGTDPAPGSEVLTNTATASAIGATAVSDTGALHWESDIPNLSIAKTPAIGAGALIPQGGTGSYTIEVRNNSHLVSAAPLLIDDPLPATLSWVGPLVGPGGPGSNWSISGPGPVGSLTTTGASTATHPQFSLTALQPGQVVQIVLAVTQDNTVPPDFDLENTATASAAGNSVSDTGVLTLTPNIGPPSMSKTVSPTFGSTNTQVTFTVTATMESLGVPSFDTTVIDTLPDGFVFDGYGPVTCISGCPLVAEFPGSTLPPVPLANGGSQLGWYFGDRPAGNGPTVVTMDIYAHVAAAFSGTGVPPAGTPVLDGVPGGDPLVNSVRSYMNLTDRVAGLLPAIPGTPSTAYDLRSAIRTASFDIRTPAVTVTKSSDAVNGEVEVGATVAYTVTVTNTGSADAYDLLVSDDMAGGKLANVNLNPAGFSLPAGVTITNPWTLADPTVEWSIVGPLAPGASVVLRYTGTTLPSSDLQPTDSTFNGDISRIINTVSVVEFHTAPIGSPNDYRYAGISAATVSTAVYTPLPVAQIQPCWSLSNMQLGHPFTFSTDIRNYYGWTGAGNSWSVFPTTSAGTAYDTNYSVTLPSAFNYLPGTTIATGVGVGDPTLSTFTPFADPVVSPDGRTLSWNLGDIPPSNQWIRLKFSVDVVVLPPVGYVQTKISAKDATGQVRRGENVASEYKYEYSSNVGACGVQQQSSSLYKGPDLATALQGGTHNFFISFNHTLGRVSENPVFVDTMPAGLTYVPGSATITSDLPFVETVTPGPGGTTVITWAFTGSTQQSISMQVPVATGPGTPLDISLVNTVSGTDDGGFSGTDTGVLIVKNPVSPTVTKTVSPETTVHGGVVLYTVDVAIPANQQYFDLIAVDQLNSTRTGYATLTFGTYLSASCIVGCTIGMPDNIVPQTLTPSGDRIGMLLGDISPDTELRVVRLQYSANTLPTTHPGVNASLTGGFPSSAEGISENLVRIADSVDTSSPGSVIYNPSNPASWWATWSTSGVPNIRSEAAVVVEVKVPKVEIQKNCGSIGTPDDPSTADPDISETVVGVPNLTCTITVRNTGVVAAYDIAVRDTPNMTANWFDYYYNSLGTYPVTSVDVLSYAPTTPSTQYSDGLGYFEWEGIDLEPGEQMQFSAQMRVSATPPGSVASYGVLSNVASIPNGWLNSPTDSVRIGSESAAASFAMRSPSIDVFKLTTNELNSMVAQDPSRAGQPFGTGSAATTEWSRYNSVGEEIPWTISVSTVSSKSFFSVSVQDTLPYGFSYKPGSARLVEKASTPSGPVTNYYPMNPSISVETADVCDPAANNAGGDVLTWDFSRSGVSPANRLWFGEYSTNVDPSEPRNDPSFGTQARWETQYRIEFVTLAGPEVSHCLQNVDNWYNTTNYKNNVSVSAVKSDGSTMTDSFDDTILVLPNWNVVVKGRSRASDLMESHGCGTITAMQFRRLYADADREALCPGLAGALRAEGLYGNPETPAFQNTSGQPYESGDEVSFTMQVSSQQTSHLASFDLLDTLPFGMTYKPGSGRVVMRAGGTGPRVEVPFEPVVTDVPPAPCLNHFATHLRDGDLMRWSFQQGAVGPAGALWTSSLGNGNSAEAVLNSTTYREFPIDAFIEVRYEVVLDTSCVKVPIYFQQFNNSAEMVNVVYTDGATFPTAGSWVGESVLGSSYIFAFDFITMKKTPDAGFTADDTTTGFDITITNYAPIEFKEEVIRDIGTDVYQLFDPKITDTFSTIGGSHYVPGTATLVNQDGVSIPLTEVSVSVVGTNTTVVWTMPNMPGSDTASYLAPNPDGTYPDPEIWTLHVPIVVPKDEPDGMVLTNHADLTSSAWSWVRGDDADITVINPSPPPVPTKTATPTTATINDVVTYSVEVPVPNQTTYFDLAYTDVVPDGLEFLGHVGTTCINALGDNCMTPSLVDTLPVVHNPDGTTTLGWYLGDLVGSARDRTIRFTYRAKVKSTFAGGTRVTTAATLTNTVQGFGNDSNVLTSDPTVITPGDYFYQSPIVAHDLPIIEPNVTVAKTIDNPTAARGAFDTITYTLNITNAGDGPAYDIRVVDDPPEYLVNITPVALTGAEVDGWTIDGPHMEWYFGVLNPGQSYTLQYTAQIVGNIDDYGIRTIDNVASASQYRGRDQEESGNRSYVGAEVTGSVPLRTAQFFIEKYVGSTCTDKTARANIGDEVIFCVSATNLGDSNFSLVEIRDLLPPGWSYVPGSATAINGSDEPIVSTGPGGSEMLYWSVPNWVGCGFLAACGVTYMYAATPGPGSAHTAVNTAAVEARDPLGARYPLSATAYRDQDTAEVRLFDAALEIKKVPDFQYLPYVPSGGPLSWDIEVSNPSDATHSNVIVTDTLPAGLTYVPGSASSPNPGFSEVSVVPGAGGTTVITWKFDQLPPNETYRIAINTPIPAGLTSLTSYLNDVQAVSDQIPDPVVNQARVIAYGPNAIGDKAFIDSNGDGIQQASELPLQGVTVRLLDSNGVFVDSRVTDSDGLYLFDSLTPGDYYIEFVAPSGYEFTAQGQGSDPEMDSDADRTTGRTARITVINLDDQFGWDAGFVQRGSIGDFIWDDRDGDGIQGPGEPGVPGATVQLLDAAGGIVASTVTDSTGQYNFSNVLPGTYSIKVIPPAGAWHFAPAGEGSDPTLDSELDDNGVSAPFTLYSGTTDRTRDGGLFRPVDLGITKTTPVATVNVGENVEWNLKIENTMSTTAYAPTHVIDPLPEFLQFVSASSDKWTCSASGQIVDCLRTDDIVPGDISNITIVTKVVAKADELINVARVDSATDSNPLNNEDDAKVAVLGTSTEASQPTTSAPPPTETTTTVPTTTETTTTSGSSRITGALPRTGTAPLMLAGFGAGFVLVGLMLMRRRRQKEAVI